MVVSNDAATNSAAASPTSSCNCEDKLEATDMRSSPVQSTATGFISPLTIMKNDVEALNRFPTITAPQIDSAYSIKIDQARDKTKRSFEKSKLLENAEYVLPRFEMSNLVLGKVLGQGGFGTVLEINAIHDVPPPQDEGEKDEMVVFRIDEFEERKKHRRKPITLGWRLRRTRSHDGFEDSHDRDIQESKSYDCITGEIVGRIDSAVHVAADVLTAGVKGVGDALSADLKQLGRRVGQNHHDGFSEFPKRDDNGHWQQRNGLNKSASDYELQKINSDCFRRPQKVSHNFSFLSWRDSKAGEEGNDAISPEEMNRSKRANDERRVKALHQDRKIITQNATVGKGEACYVVKFISQSIVEDDFQKFLQASKDLATETFFLSVLNHSHILKIRAVGQGDMFSPSYFLVLDRLHGTLFEKIEETWKTQLQTLEDSIFVWDRATKLRTLWGERMGVMKDLAGALCYLHDLRIIYRDLKPENCGFDALGNVKLFDFGLAREVRDDDDCGNGTYKLTPNTGSLRYMAPENGNKWPYNFLADSYSFGILLWEVAALERPYDSFAPKEIRDMVLKWGERPKTKDGWSERIVELMKTSWDSNFRKRPTLKVMQATLEKEIEDSLI